MTDEETRAVPPCPYEGRAPGVSQPPVYAHTYRFTGRDGIDREGVSYATGRRLGAGTDMTVEYVPADPAISRIRGMRREPFGVEGWGGVLVFGVLGTFTVIGVAFLAAGVRKGVRANHLLASGRLALGRLKEKRPTNTRINDQTVWEFTFEFQGEDLRPHEAKARTHKVADLADPAASFCCMTRWTRRTRFSSTTFPAPCGSTTWVSLKRTARAGRRCRSCCRRSW
jgi:hypothetical protein